MSIVRLSAVNSRRYSAILGDPFLDLRQLPQRLGIGDRAFHLLHRIDRDIEMVVDLPGVSVVTGIDKVLFIAVRGHDQHRDLGDFPSVVNLGHHLVAIAVDGPL